MSIASSAFVLDHPFWGRGFRPFFLLGAAYSVLSILAWSGFYAGYFTPSSMLADPVAWHAHEMIYGFVMAIVAGFLLTAVANWTGGAPVRQLHLMGLALLWIAERVVLNVEGLPFWLVLSVGTAFVPALAVSLSVALLKSWNTRNFIFLGLLSALFACNVTFMLGESRTPLYVALFMILIMISLIGGRIIPSFTVAALRRKGLDVRIHDQFTLDKIAILSLAGLALAFIFGGPQSVAVAVMAFAASFLHLLRLRRYHTLPALRDPMLWILHAGFMWLIAGLALTGLSALGIGTFAAALHALTVGAVGSMTLGMMCRVTLGHTGRDIVCRPLTHVSFVLMQAAAVLRVFGPLFLPNYHNEWIVASGLLWSVCFALYIPVYAPMLWTPRPDRQPA